MTRHNRSTGIDSLRVIGIVAVVVGHVWPGDGVLRTVLYSWHVPLFFFLTGYFWARGRSARTEVERRSRSLLVPYAVWLVVVGAVWVLGDGLAGSGLSGLIAPVLGGRYVGQPFSAFWFVTALFACTIVCRWLERFPVWVTWSVAGAAVAVSSAAPELVRFLPLGLGTGVAALVFVVLGNATRRIVPRTDRPALLGTGLLVGAALALALGAQPLDLKQADFGTPVVSVVVAAAICVGLTLLAVAVEPLLGATTGRGVRALASCGIGVVLTHAAVVWILQPFVPDVMVLVAALVVPWGAMLVLVRSGAAPWTLGVPRQGSHPLRTA